MARYDSFQHESFLARLIREFDFKNHAKWALPGLALLILFGGVLSGGMGMTEIEPGQVAVKYNTTPFAIFGPDSQVIRQQGTVMFIPYLQRLQVLDSSPQILIMEGGEEKEKDADPNHARRLTVRANDGSNFWFPKLEIHYQLLSEKADVAIHTHGRGDAFKLNAVKANSREVLRNCFGRYTFLEAANPGNYSRATSEAKQLLNARLGYLGIEITQIITPKPSFDKPVEDAIRDRQTAEQSVEVFAKKRAALVQQHDRKVQEVKETKNAELQGLLAQLSAELKKADNAAIDVKREADKYAIARTADGTSWKIAKITQAHAQEAAAKERAQGLFARINAVGAQGPDVLNLTIAQSVFPQLAALEASPFYKAAMPFDLRTTAVVGH